MTGRRHRDDEADPRPGGGSAGGHAARPPKAGCEERPQARAIRRCQLPWCHRAAKTRVIAGRARETRLAPRPSRRPVRNLLCGDVRAPPRLAEAHVRPFPSASPTPAAIRRFKPSNSRLSTSRGSDDPSCWKGTFSELELSIFRQRSQAALRLKAARGDLHTTVAIGYRRRADDRLEQDPDLRIRNALSLVFRKSRLSIRRCRGVELFQPQSAGGVGFLGKSGSLNPFPIWTSLKPQETSARYLYICDVPSPITSSSRATALMAGRVSDTNGWPVGLAGGRCAWHGHWIGGESPLRGALVAAS